MAQIVYYFYAWFRITKNESDLVNFIVPTGNFGNILAGYYAKQMGLPIDKLVIGTNENDILYRFFTSGKYKRTELKQTLSPSMDIQVSSNFERYLFYLSNKSFEKLKSWMQNFQNTGEINIESNLQKVSQKDFISASIKDNEVISIIKKFHKKFNYILDPHTAVGVCASEKFKFNNPVICLACAHPAKFHNTIENIIEFCQEIPKDLADLNNLETKVETVSCDESSVQKVILKHLSFSKT